MRMTLKQVALAVSAKLDLLAFGHFAVLLTSWLNECQQAEYARTALGTSVPPLVEYKYARRKITRTPVTTCF